MVSLELVKGTSGESERFSSKMARTRDRPYSPAADHHSVPRRKKHWAKIAIDRMMAEGLGLLFALIEVGYSYLLKEVRYELEECEVSSPVWISYVVSRLCRCN
jgi:hypothetical protein